MTSLNVSSPAELISAVPFMIGFHPADSLTVVAVRGCQLAFAVRIDLPELDAPEEHARTAVLHLAAVVAQQGVQTVAVLGYGETVRVAPAVMRISDALRRLGLTVIDELRVADGRYWSYLCADPSCCPDDGQPCQPPDSVVAAEATFAGAVALPDRAALAAQLAPPGGSEQGARLAATVRAGLRLAALAAESSNPPGDARGPAERSPGPEGDARGFAGRPADPDADAGGAQVGPPRLDDDALRLISEGLRSVGEDQGESRPAAESGEVEDPAPNMAGDDGPGLREVELPLVTDERRFLRLVRRAGRTAVREAERCYRAGRKLTDDEIAWLGLLLLHLPVRDYAWTRSRKQEWEVTLWSDVVRRVEPQYAPAPASLLAFAAWRTGLGALASVAVERALAQQEDYSLAMMLHEVLVSGLPPSMLDDWPAINTEPAASDGRHAPKRLARRDRSATVVRRVDRMRSAGRSETAGEPPPARSDKPRSDKPRSDKPRSAARKTRRRM